MYTESPQPEGGDGILSVLNVSIEALNLAKEVASITPAKAVFGSVCALLAMIRVCFHPLCEIKPLVHIYPGHHDQRTGCCRAWAILRRCV